MLSTGAGYVSSSRFFRSGIPPVVAGYNLSNVIAAVRSADSEWTDTSDAYAPAGLVLPTAPSGLTPVGVSSLAALDTELASASGKQITLAPGVYSRGSGVGFAVPGGASNCRIILDGCTINVSGNAAAFTVHWRASQIEITGGSAGATFNAVPWPQGRDIKLYNLSCTGDNSASNPDRNGTGLGVNGHRVCIERCYLYGWNGLFFTGAIQGADYDASCSGTTMTVNTVYEGTLRVGSTVQANGGTAFVKGTKIVSQLTGTAGGTGTYQVSVSQTRAAARASTFERSTNLIAANSQLICMTNGSGGIENPVRFNGVNMGLIVDCRLVCDGKFTARIHPDFGYVFGNGKVGLVRNQAEQYGFNFAQLGGVTPGTDFILCDGNTIYRVADGTYSADALMGINSTGVSGNGTTVTYDCAGDNGHGLSNGDLVSTQGMSPAAFNQTNVAVTVITSTQFTYPAAGASGTPTGVPFCISQKPGVTTFRQRNNTRYSAPTIGTAGVGLQPGGSGSPSASWPTANSAGNAAAAGNYTQTQVSAPAWSFQ